MIISQTPLRISLGGGGTDFEDYYLKHGGFVVSSAIDKYIYVIVKERFDEKIYINAARSREITDSVDEIQHELIREALKKTQINKGVEITILADIPSEGSGLGSSSSLTVGLLNAFYTYQGVQVSNETLADEASDIEINLCKQPIGRQDQYISAYGGLCAFTFGPGRSIAVERLKISEGLKRKLSDNLLLFYTDKTRKVSEILTEQKKNIPDKIDYLNRIKELSKDIYKNILSGDIDKIGEILNENWQLKKALASNISDSDIDSMYETARAAGALGGKICGAGGGGFLLVYCPTEKQQALKEKMSKYREMPFYLERAGSRIIFNQRGYEWK